MPADLYPAAIEAVASQESATEETVSSLISDILSEPTTDDQQIELGVGSEPTVLDPQSVTDSDKEFTEEIYSTGPEMWLYPLMIIGIQLYIFRKKVYAFVSGK
jgi:ABC-type uncharacterized transport system YnjBCD substrate-binding protein